MRRLIPRLGLALGMLPSGATAQDCYRWDLASPQGPPPRFFHSLVFDHSRAVCVLFDGRTGPLSGDQVYEWDGVVWRAASATPSPQRRFAHASTFDSRRQQVLVFGGALADRPFFIDDLWGWDGAQWANLTVPGTEPQPARREHALAFDSRRGVAVMFGGRDEQGVALGDTWEWADPNWALRTRDGPAPSWGNGMAYDAVRAVTVLSGISVPRETWEWDGDSWTRRAVGGPPDVQLPMTFDSDRRLCVMPDTSAPGRVWTWDGRAWRLSQSSPAPTNRAFHTLCYDSRRQRVVLFGGWDERNALGDTWEYGLYPDCDPSTGAGSLDIFDFLCFLNRYAASDPYACDCDTASGPGLCDLADFLCFQNLFQNCP